MKATLTYKNNRLQAIKLSNWKSLGMFRVGEKKLSRIDFAIHRAVKWSDQKYNASNTSVVFDRELGGEQIGFNKVDEDKIKDVLVSFDIETKVVNK